MKSIQQLRVFWYPFSWCNGSLKVRTCESTAGLISICHMTDDHLWLFRPKLPLLTRNYPNSSSFCTLAEKLCHFGNENLNITMFIIVIPYWYIYAYIEQLNGFWNRHIFLIIKYIYIYIYFILHLEHFIVWLRDLEMSLNWSGSIWKASKCCNGGEQKR